nr:retrovirus-related Pol polyprotein from transposon TNT 1-94 [Tanacetum cinerariifolium]
KFTFVKGETLYQYYWRFAQLINNMNVINMSMRAIQVNTKFINSLPPVWSKFVTDIKLARDFHTTNYDQLYSYLEQHEPKRPRNDAWYKEKAMLAEASKAGQILDEEQLEFLTDPSILDGQATQTTFLNNAAFQTENLDAYNSDCDDVLNAKAVLMANLSSYGSDVLSEVPHSETSHNDMDNQSVHAMQDSEQTQIVDFLDNEITSNSSIILYYQYLQET